MDNFDLRKYLTNNILLQEQVVSQSEIDDLVKQAVANKKDSKDGDLKEELAMAIIAALPVLIKLLGKVINKFSNFVGIGSSKKRAALDAKYAEIDRIKKEYNLGVDFNPFNDTPKEKEAKAKIDKIKKEIEAEFGTKVGDFFKNVGDEILKAYYTPFLLLIKGIAAFTKKDSKLRDQHLQEKIAKICYGAVMLFVAGKGIAHSLHHITEIKPAVTAMIEAIEGQASIKKVIAAGLAAMGLLAAVQKAPKAEKQPT